MKFAVALVTDKNYIEQTKYIIGAIRKFGKWTHDIVLICNDLGEGLRTFIEKDVILAHTKPTNYNWAKVNVFDKTITGMYDRVLYLDQDCVIFKSIIGLFYQDGVFLADDDTKKVREDFMEKNDMGMFHQDFVKLQNIINVNSKAFCSGIMRFSPRMIGDDILKQLEKLREEYKYINNLNGIPDGMAEQSILNIYFCEKWQMFKQACFWLRKRPDTILTHNTSWYAPWKIPQLKERYQECIRYFEEEM